jgi:hypothetical protein
MDINKANKSKNIRCNIEFTFTHQKKVFKKKISMESKTFARTSARRYRIVDAEEIFM